jgi:hypothetical protein
MVDDQSSARLPGVRRGRRMPFAGHDGDDRARLPPLSLQEADLPQSIPRPVHQPRDEPLHSMLSLRPFLPRLRRRTRPRRLRRARPRLFRASRRRRPGERIQRQPGRDLSDRSLHRQDIEGTLHTQMGFADGAVGVYALRRGLQHHSRRAVWRIAANSQPLPPRRERLLFVRPRALRLRVRQQSAPDRAAPCARR